MLRVERLLVLLACVGAAHAGQKFVYSGFNHLIAFEMGEVQATAFDFRRHIEFKSTCDLVAQPPLLAGAKIEDWVAGGAKSSSAQESLEFTYLGYENVLVENKNTGAYVIRRCRDFRPQLTSLPCEAFNTGSSPKFVAPNKTVFIGNNRVMIVNLETGAFAVHPFDADVHTGGDPFKFVEGPLFVGSFPEPLKNDTIFAYVQLKQHGGDMLLAHDPSINMVTGYRFHGVAKNEEDFALNIVTEWITPPASRMVAMDEDDVLFVNPYNDFTHWNIIRNGTKLDKLSLSKGNVFKGQDCMFDNVTACVGAQGCAWCPSSYTCHPYDAQNKFFCDSHKCSVDPLVDNAPLGLVVVPDCIENPDPASVHADMIDTIHEGYDQLPGHVRLGGEYRDNQGAHGSAEAAPIHPSIDNELGDDPVIIDEEYQDDLIHENNRISKGDVYQPPPPSDSAPCMDKGYDANKAVEIAAPKAADWKMNHPSNTFGVGAPVISISPPGDAILAKQEHDCDRVKEQNVTGSTNATKKVSTRGPAAAEGFEPRRGDVPSPVPEFAPSGTSTRHEEDLMNGDKTEFSQLHARWVDPALPSDHTLAPVKASSEDIGFKPKEGIKMPRPAAVAPVLRVSQERLSDPMNQGIANSNSGLVGADCTETGGSDGAATPTFNAAMMNSVNEEFPVSLEAQLDLFKDEPKHVVDHLPAPPRDEILSRQFPPAPEDQQQAPAVTEQSDAQRVGDVVKPSSPNSLSP